MDDKMILQIVPSLDIDNSNIENFWGIFTKLNEPYIQRIWENRKLRLKALLTPQNSVSAEIFGDENKITFNICIPKKYKEFIKSQIWAMWPNSLIREVNDYINFDTEKSVFTELYLKHHFIYPIKTDIKNPYTKQILFPFTNLNENEKAILQVIIIPIDDKWKIKGRKALDDIKNGIIPINANNFTLGVISIFEFILNFVTVILDKIFSTIFNENKINEETVNYDIKPIKSKFDKLSKKGYETYIRIGVQSNNKYQASVKLDEFVETLNNLSDDNEFYSINCTNKIYNHIKNRTVPIIRINGNILTNTELSFIRLPEENDVSLDKFERLCIKNTTVPKKLYSGKLPIGYHVIPNKEDRLVYWDTENIDTLVRPIIIMSDPGGGKSVMAENFCLDVAKLDYGFCFIDVSDGKAADRIISKIPKEREKDIVILDFNDLSKPIGIDFSECNSYDRFQSQFVTKMWTDFFISFFNIESHFMSRNLLRKASAVVFDEPGNTLLEVKLMIENDEYRTYQLNRIKNKIYMKRYIDFWERFNAMPFKVKQETIKPILNKIDALIDDSRIRNIICQKNSKLPKFRQLMDERKLVIIKIGEGIFGYECSCILASLLLTKWWTAALSRENIKNEDERIPFFLIMDEPQNYLGTTDTSKEMLAKARKYRLCPIMLFQTPKQINSNDKNLLKTLIDLKPHIIFGKQSEHTFKEFSEEIKPLTPSDGSHLPPYHFIAKIYYNKTPLEPFIFRSLWRPELETYDRKLLVYLFKNRFGKPVDLVEEDINNRESMNMYSNIIKVDFENKPIQKLGKAAQLGDDNDD
ncbi:type IV secretory system conjugative DNA transfer family protein [Thermosipho sp. (in: thermotogales)]|jgi:hypothetical protein|uniref:type IV secretory system conjugative DNA transfer family protein n=1 Tax=Thermosipho sp. (in: thermotogales) TaxID=1968895 RepID=UPI00257BB2EE|nr:type IV secretory system conjugative DNA transfer family protein [Thermosipho sp. (in: thermotogales)]MBZ4649147.1 CampHawk [Thermosipho sp. (in: thermotogales)]